MPEKNQNGKRLSSRKKYLKDYRLENNLSKGLKKRSFKSINFGIIIIFLIIALLAIILILLVEFKIIDNPLDNPLSQPQLFDIEDRCSLIVGQLMHTIEGSDSCEIRCGTECEVREMNFYDSEFTKHENDCNSCECYCK